VRLRAPDHRVGQLVDGNRCDRGNLGEPRPDVGEHDHDQRRQVEEQDQPRVAQAIRGPHAAHEVADGRAKRHREREGEGNARKRDAEVKEQRAGAGFYDDGAEDGRGRRQHLFARHERRGPPRE
jgi:hypothetical protein